MRDLTQGNDATVFLSMYWNGMPICTELILSLAAAYTQRFAENVHIQTWIGEFGWTTTSKTLALRPHHADNVPTITCGGVPQ